MPKQRQTCTECSMRRQKCDRNMPCGRCVKRGDADKCTREWPKEGYDPKIHRIYPRPERDGEDDEDHSDSHESPSTPNRTSPESAAEAVHPNLRSGSDGSMPRSGRPSKPSADQDADNLNPKFLEFPTWGRTPFSNLGINTIDLNKEPLASNDPLTDWSFSNGFGGTAATQISFLQLLLPTKKQLEKILEYHGASILWYHGTLHRPTFMREFEENSKGPKGIEIAEIDLRWAALLFAVMASSMSCAKDNVAQSWGFAKAERAKLTRQWFKATLSCLNLADYMWKHHLWSVQAICILSMAAHLLGFSNTQSILLGAALKIGQSLGLQRLALEEEPSKPNAAQKARATKVETGRRIWSQICVQDWFSIPFSDMYCIQKHHFTTIPPRNVEEETLELVPDSEPTISIYPRALQALGRLMADAHDAVVQASTVYEKYNEVLSYEQQIKKWLTDLPPCLQHGQPIEPSWPVWVPYARRSVIICAAHKIMMIHRNFLGRSFSDTAFQHTREACMQAAKTIIRETTASSSEDGPVLWIDQAFMVASGITLSLDIFHRKGTEPEYNEHRKLVENNISLLSKFEDSMIAARGIRLLSSLLTEQARTMATQSLDNYNRSKRLRENESAMDQGLTPGTIPFGGFEPNKRPRQRFDVPRFVESLGTGDLSSSMMRRAPGMSGMGNAGTAGPTSSPGPMSQQGYRTNSRTMSQSSSTYNGGGGGSSGSNAIASLQTPPQQSATPPSSSSSHFPSQQQQSQHPLNNNTTTTNNNSHQRSLSQPQQRRSQNLASLSQSQFFPFSNTLGGTASSLANPFSTISTNNISTINNGNSINNINNPGLGGLGGLGNMSYPDIDIGYETFEQLFPPQTGISNSFLFEDLLNFDFEM